VLASHYAEPALRTATAGAVLRDEPSNAGLAVRELEAGEHFQMLEDSVGWAWGYADSDHRVGYVRSDALTPIS